MFPKNYWLSILFLGVISCKTAAPPLQQVPAVATVGKLAIPTDEFAYVYRKNLLSADSATEQNLRDYLTLYTNFKLKVMEAESLGLDTLESFKQELDGYKKQLAQPYLTEKAVTDQLVKEAYARLQEEVSASHLLLLLPADADPADTARVYREVTALRQRATAGEDFTDLIRQHSQEPNANQTGGNLNYFTALQMVYPFEDAAYRTPKGQLSPPVRTRFGYHLIKVNDRRPAQGKVKVAHIMVRTNPEAPTEDAAAAKQKVDEIYARLQKKENWDDLCKQFSDDAASRGKGGELPPFGTGNMIPAFEEVAFGLAKPGDYARPVLTPYGWHIIKLLEKKPAETFAELEPTLRQKVSRDSRSDLNRAALVQRLRRENQFVETPAVVAEALTRADTSLVKGTWKAQPNDNVLPKTLFTIAAKPYDVKGFYDYVAQNQQEHAKTTPAYAMRLLYQAYADKQLVAHEEGNLETKFPDYKNLVKEYRDGILLFQMMDTKVWSRAITDSVGAKAYFEQHRAQYPFGQRATATVFDAASPAVLAQARALHAQPNVPVSEPGMATVAFAKNAATLPEAAAAVLQPLLRACQRDADLRLELTGYAAPREPIALARQRAQAVADYLTGNGVAATRLAIKDQGRVGRTDPRKDGRVQCAAFSTSRKAIENLLNAQAPLSLQLTEGTFQRGENATLDALQPWKTGAQTLTQNGRTVLVDITRLDPPRPKFFEEARGLVVSDYQNYLEKQWVDSLRAKNPVSFNEVEVKKMLPLKK